MEEYILKKWYPGLPKDWEEGMTVGEGDYSLRGYAPCSSKYTDVRIPHNQIENNPDFWIKPVTINLAQVDRVVYVTDKGGRIIDKKGNFHFSLQDNGKTLKVFLNE